jgi:hypothetical protein
MLPLGFEDLTLAEIEMMQAEALDGKTISDADGLQVAGAALWMLARRNGAADVPWDDFKRTLTLREIKAFTATIQADALNPTLPREGMTT